MTSLSPILNESISDMNLRIYQSKPFGNCFFTSIAKHLRLSKIIKMTGREIRKNVVKYVHDNEFIIDYIQKFTGMTRENINEDLCDLKKDGVYEVELFDLLPIIIATQYNMKISIYTWMECSEEGINESDKESYYPIHSNHWQGEIKLLYSNLEHYDLLYPTI